MTWILSTDDQPRVAALLEATPALLIRAAVERFSHAVGEGMVRLGVEHADDAPEDRRTVVQFPIGVSLFDALFNSPTGYRGHFEQSPETGLAFDGELVRALRCVLEAALPERVAALSVGPGFSVDGELKLSRDELLRGVVPPLAKVWRCTACLQPGGAAEHLFIDTHGPRIDVGNGRPSWPMMLADERSAWLDMKGAFVRPSGSLYQPKPPVKRAHDLHARGTQ